MTVADILALPAAEAAAAVADLTVGQLDELETVETRKTVLTQIGKRRRQLGAGSRSFEVADPDTARVSVGSNPRVVVDAGQPFTTTDPRLANRLARTPELKETTA
jgi:hypothetical protein